MSDFLNKEVGSFYFFFLEKFIFVVFVFPFVGKFSENQRGKKILISPFCESKKQWY
jgi:hypothetical protein